MRDPGTQTGTLVIMTGCMYKYFLYGEGLQDPNDFKLTVGTEVSHTGTWQKMAKSKTRT
jgi:hypothetical protein